MTHTSCISVGAWEIIRRMFAGRRPDQPRPSRRILAIAWWKALRPPFLIVDLIPIALGTAVAMRGTDGKMLSTASSPWGMIAMILLGCFFVHTIANIANDLFDYILDIDIEGSIGGTGIIQSGAIPPRTVSLTIFLLLAASCGIAYILLSATGLWWMVWLLLFAVGSAVFYVAPPIRYGHRGWGEVFVALNMGFLMTCGTQIALSREFAITSLPFGLIVGLMVAGILYYQSLPEIETDKESGKYTLAVKLGKERARLIFDIWWPTVWVLMANLWASGMVSIWVFLGFLTIPLHIIAARRVHRAETPCEWLALDASGHLVRKLYLLNGAALIIGIFTL